MNANELVDFYSCAPLGQINDVFIAGGDARHCQIFMGNAGYYTQSCVVPRSLGSANLGSIQHYCRDLGVPAYLYELTSPSFPIGVFATIILYFFLRYLITSFSAPLVRGPHLSDSMYTPPSKRDLRFADIQKNSTGD